MRCCMDDEMAWAKLLPSLAGKAGLAVVGHCQNRERLTCQDFTQNCLAHQEDLQHSKWGLVNIRTSKREELATLPRLVTEQSSREIRCASWGSRWRTDMPRNPHRQILTETRDKGSGENRKSNRQVITRSLRSLTNSRLSICIDFNSSSFILQQSVLQITWWYNTLWRKLSKSHSFGLCVVNNKFWNLRLELWFENKT